MKKIGIIGSRRRDTKADLNLCREIFLSIYEDGDIIVSGGCKKGGDKFAEIIAEELGLTVENKKLILHLPDKSKLDPDKMERNPKWAYAEINFARNGLIADDSDVIVAVVAEDRKGGTEDTIKKFLKRKSEEDLILVPQVPENEDSWMEM